MKTKRNETKEVKLNGVVYTIMFGMVMEKLPIGNGYIEVVDRKTIKEVINLLK